MTAMSPLRRRMIEDMTVRNLSPATQRSYVSAVAKFSRHFDRSPDRLNLEDVRAFQVHLVSIGISWPALNQIVCALRFFYGVTLGEATIPERIPYAREPRKLPVVLSADEVVAFLEAVPSLKSRAALTAAYAAGLRTSEVVGLRVEGIDSARGVIAVRGGKGGKDRHVMLSPQLLGILRAYWRLARPPRYLFPGRDDDHPLSPTVLHALPLGSEGRWTGEARDDPHAPPQLRDASPGERDRYPDHPGPARAPEPVLDGAIHAGGDPRHPGDDEPARSPDPGGHAASVRSGRDRARS